MIVILKLKVDINKDQPVFGIKGDGIDIKINSFVLYSKDGIQQGGEEKWAFYERGKEELVNFEIDIDSMYSDVFTNGQVMMERQICIKEESHFQVFTRLIIKNMQDCPVHVDSLVPINMAKFSLGSLKPLQIFISDRQKNGLPSAFTIGVCDENMGDVFGYVSESGQLKELKLENIPERIKSDEVTLFKAEDGNGKFFLLAGFVPCINHLVYTSILLDKSRSVISSVSMCCDEDNKKLEAGGIIKSEWVVLDISVNEIKALDRFVDLKRKLSGTEFPKQPPSVYCSWYYYGDSVTQQDILDNLELLQHQKFPVDVVQVDEGWEMRWGDWEPNNHFPSGMKDIAKRIKGCGYRPGIWTCPFIVEPRCKIIYHHPEWILKDHDGKHITFRMNNMDNFILDISHPEVLEWIENLYLKITREWGYTYHKLDFTRAPILSKQTSFYDAGINRAQAYRNAIKAVRRGTGDNVYIVICGGTYSAPSGFVQAHRTSSDVLSIWPKEVDPRKQTAPHTIKQNILRYWMNGLWHNDPDALMVRRNYESERDLDLTLGLMNDYEARTSALNQYWGGGIVCFTEPMKLVEKDRLVLLRHLIPSVGRSAVPRDIFNCERFPTILDTEVVPSAPDLEPWHTVSLMNWAGEVRDLDFLMDNSTVGEFAKRHERYIVSEFWTQQVYENVKYGNKITFKNVKPHSAVHLRITGVTGEEPVVVHTSGHFSMGREITEWNYKENNLNLRVDWQWNEELAIKILAPHNRKWETGQRYNIVKVQGKGEQNFTLKLC
jgi:hypothetical protein